MNDGLMQDIIIKLMGLDDAQKELAIAVEAKNKAIINIMYVERERDEAKREMYRIDENCIKAKDAYEDCLNMNISILRKLKECKKELAKVRRENRKLKEKRS